ncbi:MAG: hypothetical protein JST06_05390 [Bacteroidetes bacterium]|nr:hypothetical protein [Bacteroidota bacterium]MBS1629658.1 hypothetical protein [Bacteroidota bacterium]
MEKKSRELLLTTKAAEKWQEQFDAQVDSILETISKLDTQKQVEQATEVMDVYHHSAIDARHHVKRGRRLIIGERPFEFLTFRN